MLFNTGQRPGKYLLSVLQNRLDKELQNLYFEQMMFQGAFLAKCAEWKGIEKYKEIAEDTNNMSIEEHKIFVNGEYTEQTYKILLAMHKISRNIPVIYDPRNYSTSTSLLDPNMFPIHTISTKDIFVIYESIWDTHKKNTEPKLMDKVGHILKIEKSSINHPQAGNGVFVYSDNPIYPGTLLGFFPGVIYNKDTINKSKILNRSMTELPYLLRWNGNAVFHDEHLFYPPFKLGYGAEEYIEMREKNKKEMPIEVLPQQINPYALGHLINHPPPGVPPNACLIDFEIPESFFPSFLLKHFPYMRYSISPSAPPTPFHTIGIISLNTLKNEELFINYGTERFQQNYIPDWFEDPPDNFPIANFLCKEDCLHDFSRLNKMLMKWDSISMSEFEKLEKSMLNDREQRKKTTLEEPKLFEKYYKK
ncbi:hypothetical protein SteCoe_19176 [Stentor coeruleus]|uniref:SET domain-containing protein n=1 Tax=Stentor coeruleus TaxID=5963 RepID=A0A1R2BVC6_9CILI|nr:hypothetical protein SteCoe_19176 [Stentor coeruleus]